MKFAAILIFIIPLLSSLITGLGVNILSKKKAAIIACGSMIIATIAAAYLFYLSLNITTPIDIARQNWLTIDGLNILWSIHIDRLTCLMFAVVSLISMVVHIYSIGYMEDDPHIQKFFCFLSLFTFFMLVLVGANNFLQLFFGWEGVGLCSYLLIGFWYQKSTANAAAIKAFIVNRCSDLAFIVGMALIFTNIDTLNFTEVFHRIPELLAVHIKIFSCSINLLDLVCLLLFIGCMGKSAQIGFHVWLPDAMEGPTPISALIHAATMVTAGIFLLVKCSALFEYSSLALTFIALVGGITALLAATIACTQTDIKRIIAYSTCSQLGYMVFACGISAYRLAIFHLITHAFFKALLFLSAGSVIHATHEQDITKMGGLKDEMPLTYTNFIAGSLAITGIFPLSGFYSKDLILEAAYNSSLIGNIVFILGVISALLTAIYSMKIIVLTFHGHSNLVLKNIVDSPRIMNIPLVLLVAGSFCAGALGYYILRIDKETGYLFTTIFNLHSITHHSIPILIKLLPLVISICGGLLGIAIYKTIPLIRIKQHGFNKIIKNGYYFNELYNKTIVTLVSYLSSLSNLCDQKIIDKSILVGFTKTVNQMSKTVKFIQSGYVFYYAFAMILSIVIFMTYFLINFIMTQPYL